MLVTLRGLGLILHSPCIYNDYLKVLLFKFINPFLSNNNRVHFCVTRRKQKMIMVILEFIVDDKYLLGATFSKFYTTWLFLPPIKWYSCFGSILFELVKST